MKIRIKLPAQKFPTGQGHDDLGGVELGVASCGTLKSSCATYKLPGESTEDSLMRHFGDVTPHIVEQLNALVIQFFICAYRNCNILAFSLESVTLLDQITRSKIIFFKGFTTLYTYCEE